jgi:predicted MPP superfamily phosphohydrolase
MTRRAFIGAGSATAAGLALYSGTRGRHELELLERTFPIRNLPGPFHNFSFIQISDIHFEEYTEAWFLEEVVRKVNELNPELVLITGDFISHGPMPFSFAWRAAGVCAEILSTLKAPLRFGVLGNHDVVAGAGHVIAPLEAHGIPVLVDSYFPLTRGGDTLWICGSNDAGVRHPDLNMAVPPFTNGAPVILMCHEPDYADHVVRHPRFPAIDLMLSGHTHGGQVRLPIVGPLILPPMGQKYIEGRFHFGHMQLYVNRGIGAVGVPFRLNCPSEITKITLVPA